MHSTNTLKRTQKTPALGIFSLTIHSATSVHEQKNVAAHSKSLSGHTTFEITYLSKALVSLGLVPPPPAPRAATESFSVWKLASMPAFAVLKSV
jgi:hypothetical protein